VSLSAKPLGSFCFFGSPVSGGKILTTKGHTPALAGGARAGTQRNFFAFFLRDTLSPLWLKMGLPLKMVDHVLFI
jgi:hypothetical protein